MILCQLTDLHIRAPGSLAYGRVDTNAFFEAAIEQLARLSPAPDAYLMTGDLTDFGRADEYAALVRGIAKLGKPAYLLPGNHDERSAMRTAFPDMTYLHTDLPWLQYRVDLDGSALVVLDTVVPGKSHGTLDAARLTFVEILQNDADLREPSRAASLRILDGIAPASAYAGLADVQRAYLLRDMGRLDDAIAAARASGGADDPITVRALADLYRGAQRYAEAEAMFDILVKKGGDAPDWRLIFARGAMRERTGRWTDAEADLQRALTLAPDQPEVMNYLAYAWIDRNERSDQALELLHRAVGIQPNAGHIVDSLGWAYYQRGDYEAALLHLERAIELEPDNYEVNDHLGDLYWRLGRKREARFQWTRALTMKPDEKSTARINEKVATGLPPAPKAQPLARAQ
jgi:Flp pilus assembly protein TadD